jgi:hypothetical protein
MITEAHIVEENKKLRNILKRVPVELLRNELRRRSRRGLRPDAPPIVDREITHTPEQIISAVATAWGIDTLPILRPKTHPKKTFHARLALVDLLRSHAGFTNPMIRQYYQTTESTVFCWRKRHLLNLRENPTYAQRFHQALINLTPQQQPL